MSGFFDLNKLETDETIKLTGCIKCKLFKNCKSPQMKPYGDFDSYIMVIGEAPGKTEDLLGKPFQGEAGKVLQQAFKDLGYDLFTDCIVLNAIKCRPATNSGANRTPTTKEITACRSSILRDINFYKPKVILLLGSIAVESVIGANWKKDLGGISKWQGTPILDRTYNTYLLATYHPSFILRNPNDTLLKKIWYEDLSKGIDLASKKLPKFEPEDVRIIESKDEADIVLDKIYNEAKSLSFDLETTGLKPYYEKQQIAIISFCYDDKTTYSMPFELVDLDMLKKIMESGIGKIAANMKFEDTWLRVKHNIIVNNWVFDTMLASHILDNRSGITSLKFQVYVNFGIADYDSEVEGYLKAEDSNSLNKVMEAMKDSKVRKLLLKYCGLDSLYTFRLAEIQMNKLGKELPYAD